MNKFIIQKKLFGNGQHSTAVIIDPDGRGHYPHLSRFVGMMHIDSIDRYIAKISKYSFDPSTIQDFIPEQDLINDYAIRGVSGNQDMLQFVNYNIDEDIEEISKQDLLDIFYQWKKILNEG